MAVLSKHGREIGRIEFSGHRKVFMADGSVLKDYGHGWKLTGKLKPGITPEAAFENAKANQARKHAESPALAEYVSFVRGLAPLSRRWRLIMALQMMPGDPDGVWSECCDGFGDHVGCDLDDIVKLCRLYQAAIAQPVAA